MMGRLVRQHWQFRRRRSLLETAAGFIAVALTVSVAWTGHAAAAAGPNLPWRITADALHLFAAAVWPAGLLPFALFLRASRGAGGVARPVLAVVRRFSKLSLLAVGVLITTGIVNSVFLVGSFPAMVTTAYGRILCLKLVLLLFILGLASWNRFRLLPLLFAHPAPANESAVSPVLRRMQNFVAAEAGLAAAIVVVVSVLGITPPPG